jgi:iron complex outermembrane receptor protein
MRFISFKKITVTFFALYFCLIASLYSQTRNQGAVKGRVFDSDTNMPLLGANVMLKGTLLGTACDLNGSFEITNLNPGIYQIEATMIGYRKGISDEFRVIPGQVTEIEIGMTATVIEQPTVVVTASKRKQYIEDAPTSVDVIGMYDIQARGLTTLDDMIQNTSGVGIIRGQVDLRGSSGFNWSAGSRILMMVDGHPLIAGDTGSIPWDVIPVDSLGCDSR